MTRDLFVVVEDEPMMRADAAFLLDQAGMDVVAVDNADEALAFVAAQPDAVAAIFTDIQMPGRSDGLHLAELVSRHWPEIMVLVTSGRVAPTGPLPSNVRFIPKPWRPQDVLDTLQGASA